VTRDESVCGARPARIRANPCYKLATTEKHFQIIPGGVS
jgi:hypothetical protein